jgi:hypothetical protein
MMLPKKLPKRLFKSKDVIHSYQHDRSAKSRMKLMSREYEDVLQNIEIALVVPAHEDPTIDDRMIDETLQISINRISPPTGTDSRVVRLWQRLGAIRAMRDEVPEEIWLSCLGTVQESVRRHSRLAPAETGYLDFVSQYVM